MKIIDIQRYLKALGHDPGAADGIWGPRTRAAGLALVAAQGGPEGAAAWSKGRAVVAVEQAIMAAHGVETGPVDGLWGPQTRYAHTQFAAGVWRDGLITPEPEDARMPASVRNTWPRQAEAERQFGPVGENQAMLQLPFPMRLAWDKGQVVTRFSIHERAHDSAARVFRRIHEHYGEAEVVKLRLDLFGGCLNVRRMRGGSAWSMHSWGIAIDFDPEENRLRWGSNRARLARPEYEAFWRFWTEEGWLSLGHARDFDWMHVQAARL